jgi:hypothetical protein
MPNIDICFHNEHERMGDVNDAILVAEATPLFPPRPDAIVTMLTSDDFLPGAQTLLYSVKVLSILS